MGSKRPVGGGAMGSEVGNEMPPTLLRRSPAYCSIVPRHDHFFFRCRIRSNGVERVVPEEEGTQPTDRTGVSRGRRPAIRVVGRRAGGGLDIATEGGEA